MTGSPAAAWRADGARAPAARRGDAGGLSKIQTTVPDICPEGSEGLDASFWLVSTHPAYALLRRLKLLALKVRAAGADLEAQSRSAGSRPWRPWFVTLTYKGVGDWLPEHISSAIRAYRRWCDGHGVACRYVWVAELQARGAMHYHLIAWLPACLSMPKWDRQRRRDGRPWWPHGITQRELARSGIGYLTKYLSKAGELHEFPRGARLYGAGGLSADGRATAQWWRLPEWCRRLHGVGEVVRRSGALVVRATGHALAARFAVRVVRGYLIVRPLLAVAERFHAGPWSAWPRVTPCGA